MLSLGTEPLGLNPLAGLPPVLDTLPRRLVARASPWPQPGQVSFAGTQAPPPPAPIPEALVARDRGQPDPVRPAVATQTPGLPTPPPIGVAIPPGIVERGDRRPGADGWVLMAMPPIAPPDKPAAGLVSRAPERAGGETFAGKVLATGSTPEPIDRLPSPLIVRDITGGSPRPDLAPRGRVQLGAAGPGPEVLPPGMAGPLGGRGPARPDLLGAGRTIASGTTGPPEPISPARWQQVPPAPPYARVWAGQAAGYAPPPGIGYPAPCIARAAPRLDLAHFAGRVLASRAAHDPTLPPECPVFESKGPPALTSQAPGTFASTAPATFRDHRCDEV